MNDKLLSGPDLLRNLVGIIFRFREHQIAITADIESMFLRVAVPKEECRVLRFLWRDRPDDNIGIFPNGQRVPQRVPILVSNKAVEITKRSFR